jgi:hypothetical protein
MRARNRVFVLIVTALLAVGGKCGGGGGGGGGKAKVVVQSPDEKCAALGNVFPPGFDFVPGDDRRVWVAEFPATLLPFDVSATTPKLPGGVSPFTLPFDSDGDGRDEGSVLLPLAPVLDDIQFVSADLGLLTASSYEEVLFFSPSTGALVDFDVSVPAAFDPADNIFLPAPGSVESRTGLSTFACVRPDPGALDSRGELISDVLPVAGYCDPSVTSFRPTFTSGAAIAGDYLFVSTSNLGDDAGSANTQYLTGSVQVYDIDPAAVPPMVGPNEAVPVIHTTGFNPTHVTAFETGTRRFALVTVSGAIGIAPDDPATPEVEAFGLALSDAAIDVIDADSLELVGTIPLGPAAASTAGLTVDPTGRFGVVGSTIGRELLAVDLSTLESLPSSTASPVVLGGAAIFSAGDAFALPARVDGAPASACPGFVADVAFDGSRIYATESCDGTIAVVDVDLSGSPPFPLPQDRFVGVDLLNVAAPIRADTLGEPHQPGMIAVRPGAAGAGPEILFLMGEPEGLLCGIDD